MVTEKKLTDQEKWEIDEVIMKYWDSKTDAEKKKAEYEYYKLFKWHGFRDCYIKHLRENDCQELADEMEHFVEIYHKVPHEHEKRLAA